MYCLILDASNADSDKVSRFEHEKLKHAMDLIQVTVSLYNLIFLSFVIRYL